jgi:Ca-activated chloride channel family protein
MLALRGTAQMTLQKNIAHRFPATRILLLIAVAILAVPAQTPSAQEHRILLTAVDKDQHFVTSLRREDVRIIEDGAPREITSFQLISDQSASVAILIDVSASQERTLPAQRLAARSFVDGIIKPARDRAAVATFTGTLQIQQDLTNDLQPLRQAIARAEFVPPPGYVRGGLVVGRPPPVSRTPATLASSTAVWDAVVAACDQLLSQSNVNTRRAIILLTDGDDTISKSKLSDAVARAIRDNVAIYSIGIGDAFPFRVAKDELRKLSERTGGRAFFPKKTSDLAAIFNQIGEELRNQYSIVYSSIGSARGPGKIQVEIVNPALRNRDIQLAYEKIALKK